VCVWLPACRCGVRLARYLKHSGSSSAGASKLVASLEPGSRRPGSCSRAIYVIDATRNIVTRIVYKSRSSARAAPARMLLNILRRVPAAGPRAARACNRKRCLLRVRDTLATKWIRRCERATTSSCTAGQLDRSVGFVDFQRKKKKIKLQR
jgi:hypothetical protein